MRLSSARLLRGLISPQRGGLNLLIAALVSMLTVGLAWPTASFYNEPRLVEVMLVLAAGWLLSGFKNIGIVEFRRRMDFRPEFIFMASRRVIAFVIGLAAAILLRSYWALVIGMIAGRAAGVALSYLMNGYRPTLKFWFGAQSRRFFEWHPRRQCARRGYCARAALLRRPPVRASGPRRRHHRLGTGVHAVK